jgi:hypothetical protein
MCLVGDSQHKSASKLMSLNVSLYSLHHPPCPVDIVSACVLCIPICDVDYTFL